MGAYFFDTSAVVKRYVAEPGHHWILSVCNPSAGHLIHVAEIAHVEVVAAFSRMVRVTPRRLNVKTRDRLIADFRRDAQHDYGIVPTNLALYVRAAGLCQVHPLRAYDAIQLASALTVRDVALAAGAVPPVFVCADAGLLAAAAAEGLATEDPRAHP